MLKLNVTPTTTSATGSGLMLTSGAKQISVKSALVFDSEGRLDFDTILDNLVEAISQEANIPSSAITALSSNTEYLRNVIINSVITKNIHNIEDILSMFDLDGEVSLASGSKVKIPLRMKGSGRRLLLDFDLNKEFDPDVYVNEFEQCYREVLHVDK